MEDKRKLKRKILIEFMKYKAAFLGGKYRDKFFTEKDEKRLHRLGLKRIERMFDRLDLYMLASDRLYDAAACPYCHDVCNNCYKCLYAEHHGICSDAGSTYNKITVDLEKGITEIIGENLLKYIWNMLKIKYELSEGMIYRPYITTDKMREVLKRFLITLNTMINRNDYQAVDLLIIESNARVSRIFTKIQDNISLALNELYYTNRKVKINFRDIYPYCEMIYDRMSKPCDHCRYSYECEKEKEFDIRTIVQLWENILFDVCNLRGDY